MLLYISGLVPSFVPVCMFFLVHVLVSGHEVVLLLLLNGTGLVAVIVCLSPAAASNTDLIRKSELHEVNQRTRWEI